MMTARVLRPVITFSTVGTLLIAALAVYAFLAAGTSHADSVYKPATGAQYCNDLSTFSANSLTNMPAIEKVTTGTCPSETFATNTVSDTTTLLDETVGDLNFAGVVTFSPVGSQFGGGAVGGIAALPAGAQVGGLRSLTTLGIGGNNCKEAITVEFMLYNVALPDNAGDPRASTNIAWPQAEGSTNRHEWWISTDVANSGVWDNGAGPGDGSPTGGWATPDPTSTDPDVDHVNPLAVSDPAEPAYTHAFHDSTTILHYPGYLLNYFDDDFVNGQDGAGDPIVPAAVYGGVTQVAGTWVPLYFAQFDAGDLDGTLPEPLGLMTAEMGAPNVSVLNDPTEVKLFPSSITDFCTPLNVTTLLYGTAKSYPGGAHDTLRHRTPATGATGFTQQFNMSQRDTDQDSYENSLDPCITGPQLGDPRANPPTAGSDDDGDNFDNLCDPDDATGIFDANFGDEDLDDFPNRQDNCPAAANTGQENDEVSVVPAGDFGPVADGIGNPCDSEVGTLSVVQNRSSGTWTVDISMADSEANGRFHVIVNHVPHCFGLSATPTDPLSDTDGDGYCQAQDGGLDGDTGNACLSTAPPSCAVRHAAWAGAAHPLRQMDIDLDGIHDARETYNGTDATKSCAATPESTVAGADIIGGMTPGTVGGVNDETVDNYAFDFDDNRLVDGSDVLKFGLPFNKGVNAGPFLGYPGERFDFNNDGFIDGSDVLQFGIPFTKRCGAGTVGMPGPFAQQ